MTYFSFFGSRNKVITSEIMSPVAIIKLGRKTLKVSKKEPKKKKGKLIQKIIHNKLMLIISETFYTYIQKIYLY